MYFPFHKSVYPLEVFWSLIPFFNRFWKHLTIKWQALRLKGPRQLNYSMDNFGSDVNVIMCIKIFKIGLFINMLCRKEVNWNEFTKNGMKLFTAIRFLNYVWGHSQLKFILVSKGCRFFNKGEVKNSKML